VALFVDNEKHQEATSIKMSSFYEQEDEISLRSLIHYMSC